MSSHIYIDLSYVLTHASLFELKVTCNVSIEDARDEYRRAQPDIEWIESCLEPVYVCKFGIRELWRHVEITTKTDKSIDLYLRVKASGSFLTWLMTWLHDHNIPYDITT